MEDPLSSFGNEFEDIYDYRPITLAQVKQKMNISLTIWTPSTGPGGTKIEGIVDTIDESASHFAINVLKPDGLPEFVRVPKDLPKGYEYTLYQRTLKAIK